MSGFALRAYLIQSDLPLAAPHERVGEAAPAEEPRSLEALGSHHGRLIRIMVATGVGLNDALMT
jgi:hypothetical protein